MHDEPTSGSSPDAADPRSASGDVAWRELEPGVWVGRAKTGHVGMIQRGRRFTFTDATDGVHPGYDTLSAAQSAATGPIPVVTATNGPDSASRLRPVLGAASLPLLALAIGVLALVGFVLLWR